MRQWRRGAAWLVFMLSLVCSASDSSSTALDRAGESWTLPQPVLDAPERMPGEDALPATVRETLDLQRAFFARDFALLDRALMQACSEPRNQG